MPDQRMAAHLQAARLREIQQRVAAGKVIGARRRFDHVALHFIFRHQDRGIAGQKRGEVRILEFIAGGGAAEQNSFIGSQCA